MRACARPGCEARHTNLVYCSRSCNMRHRRSLESPARRREIAQLANRAQWADQERRLLARVKCAAPTEDRRILLAWRMGRATRKVAAYKARQKASAA